jgi:hypothetical protein
MLVKMGISRTAGAGAGDALAEVVEVSHDEDDEDCGFGDDEARHAHDAARGQFPGCVRVLRDDGGFAQSAPSYS